MKASRARRAALAWLAGGLLISTPWAAAADGPVPPWIYPGDLAAPSWARSVVPRPGDGGHPGDLVLFADASRASARRAVTAPGASFPFFAARRGSGCSGTWWLVGPLAWTCSDDAVLSPAPPEAAPGPPPPAYFYVRASGTAAYASLDSAEEGTADRDLEAGWAVSVVDRIPGARETWAKTTKGLFISMNDLIAASPSAFRGEAVEGASLDWAWVLADRASTWPTPVAKGKPSGSRARFERVSVREVDGGMVRIEDGVWVAAAELVRPGLSAPPAEVTRPGERWIDVDTSTQTLVAYEGERPVYATLVSTGAPATPTAHGVFRVWVKLFASDMDNVERGDLEAHYSLEDVPFVQFFDRTTALHGTYWHRDFGHVRSHGCVNLSPADARWVFDFTGPRLAPGWLAAYPVAVDAGTVVRVR